LPEGEKPAAKALVDFARMDGVSRLLGQDIIHFDLRDPDRAYLRKKPKAQPQKKPDSGANESSEERGETSASKSDGAA
jgi:cell division protein FtsQ